MYTLLVNGEAWPGPQFEQNTYNGDRPLIHQILESLGVLLMSPSNEAEDPDEVEDPDETESPDKVENPDEAETPDEALQSFYVHPPDNRMMSPSAMPSPPIQITRPLIKSSLSLPQPVQPQSPIAVRRSSRDETNPTVMNQSMAEMLFTNTLFPASNQFLLLNHGMAYSTERQ